jgi:hypothetical protein
MHARACYEKRVFRPDRNRQNNDWSKSVEISFFLSKIDRQTRRGIVTVTDHVLSSSARFLHLFFGRMQHVSAAASIESRGGARHGALLAG